MTASRFDGRSTCDDVLSGLDLSGKTMLVTGANSGIGFETARSLAMRGAHVVIGCRTAERAAEAASIIRGLHPAAELTELALDLTSFANIRSAVATLTAPRFDAVICNAGILATKYETTADGIESTVGVCHFGHFLLVSLLMDKIRAAAPSRVVMVSSESHRHPRTLDFDRFPLEKSAFKGLIAYGQAKLCNVLFANELTRRYGRDGVASNSLHPGSFIGTSISRSSVAAQALFAIARPFTKTVPQGAATTVYCAASPDLEGIGGRYYSDCQEKKASTGAHDEATAQQLWELSVERVK